MSVVRFHTSVSPGLVTYADVECVLRAIDKHTAHCLGKEAERVCDRPLRSE